MQAKFPNRLRALLILSLFSTALWAQEAAPSEKKIFIAIHGKNADGSKVTKTLMKSGADAENFDTDKYVKDNTKDLLYPVVVIKDKNDVNETKTGDPKRSYINRYTNMDWGHGNTNWTNKGVKKGFLGVSENDEDTEQSNGAKVNITRNSGASKAGLKSGDVILQLNETPIKAYTDVSTFMRTTKPNDKVQVKYSRNGTIQSTSATLGQPEDAWQSSFNQEKEACLGVYTYSFREAAVRGAKINSFTTVSAAKEEAMQIGDVITAVNGIGVKTHQELWDEIAKYKPKQIVTVSYARADAAKKLNVSLKACRPKEDEKVILVLKEEEASQKINVAPVSTDRLLKLESFSASPNPTADMAHIQFTAEAVPTTVSLCDLSGKVLFQQILNDFNGVYSQRFDLNAYAKGIVMVLIAQGEKVFTKQIVVE